MKKITKDESFQSVNKVVEYIENDLTFDDKPPFQEYLNDPKATKTEDIKTAIYIPIKG